MMDKEITKKMETTKTNQQQGQAISNVEKRYIYEEVCETEKILPLASFCSFKSVAWGFMDTHIKEKGKEGIFRLFHTCCPSGESTPCWTRLRRGAQL